MRQELRCVYAWGLCLRTLLLPVTPLKDPFRKTSLVLADLTVENCRDNKLLKLCKVVAERFLDAKYQSFAKTIEVYGKVSEKKDAACALMTDLWCCGKSSSLKRKDSNGRMVWWVGSGSGSSATVAAGDDVDDDDGDNNVDDKKKKRGKAARKAPSK